MATTTAKPTMLTNMKNSDNQPSAMTTVTASMKSMASQEIGTETVTTTTMHDAFKNKK